MIISYKKNATSSDALMHIANPNDSNCNNFQATTIANADDQKLQHLQTTTAMTINRKQLSQATAEASGVVRTPNKEGGASVCNVE